MLQFRQYEQPEEAEHTEKLRECYTLTWLSPIEFLVQFVISGGNPAKPFELWEEAFNQLTFLIQAPVHRPRIRNIALWRDRIASSLLRDVSLNPLYSIVPPFANRTYTDCQGPYASGNFRHCAPLRTFQSIPLSMFRLPFRGRPHFPALSGLFFCSAKGITT